MLDDRKSKEKTLIIGAGMAGITCARKLQESDYKVTVLEARNRTGCKVFTDRSSGIPVGLGASVIHDAGKNSLMPLAKRWHFPLKPAHYDDVWLYDSKMVRKYRRLKLEKEFGSIKFFCKKPLKKLPRFPVKCRLPKCSIVLANKKNFQKKKNVIWIELSRLG